MSKGAIKTNVRKPLLKPTPASNIPLGAVVHDVSGRPWVYVGWRVTAVGSINHRFCKAQLGKSTDMPWEYNAVNRETLLKKFPDIGRVWPA